MILVGLTVLVLLLWAGSKWATQPSVRLEGLKVIDLDSAGFKTAVELAVDSPRCEPLPVYVHREAPSLKSKLHSIDWFQFEKLMAAAFRKLGYQVERRGGAKADDGIDLVIERDGKRTAVQCKHWKSWLVATNKVRELLGAMTGAGIENGMLVTLKGCTPDAKAKAREYGITILDEPGILNMLREVDAAFDPVMIPLLDDRRKNCPRCESMMVLRTAQRGALRGQRFWGCSKYPACRYVLKT
ncbi:MAG: restriction endonuclease [Limisphaerales bacterium]